MGPWPPQADKDLNLNIPPNPMSWYLYVVKCQDTSLYTGITTDIPRRIKEHNSKKGAFYTKNKVPVELVYQEAMSNQSEARKREAAIKKLTKKEKLELINDKSRLASVEVS
jgi:putative endonuclease